ncbi:MAG: lysine--tRNA ligase, partial [Candidatus Aminicenantes bacterium]
MVEKKDFPKKENHHEIEETKKGDQELARENKMEKLAQKGIELFPHNVKVTHSVFDIVSDFASLSSEDLEAKKVNVITPGRIVSIRRMGRATFFHIADSSTRLQAYIRENRVGKRNYAIFSLIDIGDIISVEGLLFKTKTGELTVFADSFTFLAKCLHPLPEKWHGLQDVELRYRKRYLDLIMSPKETEVFRLRSALITSIRKFFDQRG